MDDTPQFEKDAKKTRGGKLANLIMGKYKEPKAESPKSETYSGSEGGTPFHPAGRDAGELGKKWDETFK